MKRAILLVMAVMLLGMTACTKAPAEPQKPEPAPIKQAETQKPAPQKVDKLPDFSIKDLNGNLVTNDFFKDNKLTIVTVWSTT